MTVLLTRFNDLFVILSDIRSFERVVSSLSNWDPGFDHPENPE